MQLNKLRNIINSVINDNPSIVFFTVFLQLFSVQLDLLFGQFVQLLLGFRIDDAHLQTLPNGVGVVGMAEGLEMFRGVFPGILSQDFVWNIRKSNRRQDVPPSIGKRRERVLQSRSSSLPLCCEITVPQMRSHVMTLFLFYYIILWIEMIFCNCKNCCSLI